MFSKNVKYLRKKYGITQEELASQLGYKSFVTVSKWESGDSRPQAEKLQRLATIFHVSVDDLLNKDLTSNSAYKKEKSVEKEGVEYYTDPKTVEIANELKDNPGLRLLFDAGKDLPPEDILKTLDFIKHHL